MSRRTTGTGRYHTGEADLTIVGNTYSGDGPLIVVCHGTAQTHTTYIPLAYRHDLEVLANLGCVVVIPDFLGANGTWGNDAALTRIGEIRTYAAATWGADLTRMGFIGDSAGAMDALNYHWSNPSLVRCTAARIPVVAADALHDRNVILGNLINSAYTNEAGWDAAKANRDPSASGPVALIEPIADDVRIWYSTDDGIVLPADITTFTNLTGVRAIPLGAIGHDQTTLAAAVHADAQAAWIWSRLNT